MKGVLTYYETNISNRSLLRFIKGFIARVPRYLIFLYARLLAKKRGAVIGENTCLLIPFAKKLNSNIKIGNNTSINTDLINNTLFPVTIGNNVIIGNDVKLLISSHDIDDPNWYHTRKSDKLIIEDYVWICPYSIILPSVEHIGKGAVIGAGSVVVKDVPSMSVVSGNPAKEIRKRENIHNFLCVESLLGGDLLTYCKTWIKYRKREK